MKQFVIIQKYDLSTDMLLGVCYIAQDHELRNVIGGNTIQALQRRSLLDKENELTSSGWICYLELTDAGPCPTNSLDGYKAKDPRLLHSQAKPRLETREKAEEDRRRLLAKASFVNDPNDSSRNQIYSLMNQDELRALGVEQMSCEQRDILTRWGLRMQKLCLSQNRRIDCVNYGGHVLILSDGTQWQVDESDLKISKAWSEMDRVIVIDGEMFKLDESEKVRVEQEA